MAKRQLLDAAGIAAMVNQEFGENTMVRAVDAIGLVKPRFSTGSFALDILTGGAPEGAIELLLGEEGSAKSLGLMQRAASFLKKHPEGTFVLINAEKTNDAPFLELNGVDTSRTQIVEPDSGEQAWDVIHMVAANATKVYIGIDSLDALVPLAELESDMDEVKVAPAARQNNKGFRKLISLMKSDITTAEHRITVGIIAQVRVQIGLMFGDPNKPVGGKGSAYASMQILKCRKVKDMRTKGKSLMDKSCYGTTYEVSVKKSKGRGQGETIQYDYYRENYQGFKRGEIDTVSEVIPFALKYKLVKQAGAWFHYADSKNAMHKCQGEDKLRDAIAADPDTLAMMMDEIKSHEDARHAITHDVLVVAEKPAKLKRTTKLNIKKKRAKRA